MSVELNYRINGPYDAPVVVLSNSVGASMEMWGPQIPALSVRFRVLRYDQRGHGESPVPPGPYNIEDLGQDVLDLLDRNEVERAHYVGLSIGGMTALSPAANAPERIDGIRGARLEVLDPGAHLVNIERAPEVTDLILDHLDTKDGA